jgi:hypothetical protein
MRVYPGQVLAALSCVFLSLLLSACSPPPSLQTNAAGGLGPGSVMTVKEKTYDEVWQASLRAVGKNLTIVESNRTLGTIKAKSPTGPHTWGDVVVLIIRRATPGMTFYKVEVQSEPLLAGSESRYWEPSILADIKRQLYK